MQISTRVGVVQAIGRFPQGLIGTAAKLGRLGRGRKRVAAGVARPVPGVGPRRRAGSEKKNRTLAGPGSSLSARGPTITFQRGTADGATIAIWEDGQPAAASKAGMAEAISVDNTKGRMPAMRRSQRRFCPPWAPPAVAAGNASP